PSPAGGPDQDQAMVRRRRAGLSAVAGRGSRRHGGTAAEPVSGDGETSRPADPLLGLRLGTSSWAYEGWRGIVYHRPYSKSRFAQDCLAEYAACQPAGRPLFRTVCIDHTFYRPGGPDQLAHYAAQVPEDFHFCSKVWEKVTIPVYARLPHRRPAVTARLDRG